MTVAPEADAVPAPSWHGSPPDASERYLAFVSQGRQERIEHMIREAENAIANANEEIGWFGQEIKKVRDHQAGLKAAIAQAQQNLLALPTTEELDAEIERIKALPNVLGIRVDSNGRPVIHIRTFVTYEGQRVDLGDFEIFFKAESNPRSWPVSLTRLNPASGYDYQSRLQFRSDRWYNESLEGEFRPGITVAQALAELYRNGLIYEFVVTLNAAMCSIDEDLVKCFNPLGNDHLSEPEPSWQGYMEGLGRALGKVVDDVKNGPTKQQIESLQDDLKGSDRDLRVYVERIRHYNEIKRTNEAELRNQRALLNGDVDEAAARQELRYILRLPGVMGVKFDPDGTPVFHVRTTHVLDNRRYDLGDYEVALTQEGRRDSAGVVRLLQTRRAREGQSGFYFHDNGDFDQDRSRWIGWFCFGVRADELSNLFRRGSFGQMMHLLVNTMNGINPDSRTHGYLSDAYREIPMNAIWRHGRRRPRRRPRARTTEPEVVGVTVKEQAQPDEAPALAVRGLARVIAGLRRR